MACCAARAEPCRSQANAPNTAQARDSVRSIATNTRMARSKRRDPIASNNEEASDGARAEALAGYLLWLEGRPLAASSRPARTDSRHSLVLLWVSGRPERSAQSGVGLSGGDEGEVRFEPRRRAAIMRARRTSRPGRQPDPCLIAPAPVSRPRRGSRLSSDATATLAKRPVAYRGKRSPRITEAWTARASAGRGVVVP